MLEAERRGRGTDSGLPNSATSRLSSRLLFRLLGRGVRGAGWGSGRVVASSAVRLQSEPPAGSGRSKEADDSECWLTRPTWPLLGPWQPFDRSLPLPSLPEGAISRGSGEGARHPARCPSLPAWFSGRGARRATSRLTSPPSSINARPRRWQTYVSGVTWSQSTSWGSKRLRS